MTSRFGEAEIIRQVAQRFAGLSHGVQVGIGDDAAVLDIEEPISQLLTTDTLIEGVHFDLRYMSLADVGYKALAVNLSDINAMGGESSVALGTLGVPRGATVEDIDALLDGIADALPLCRDAGQQCSLIGGDTVAAPQWIIGFTVVGQVTGQPLLRSGARVGDEVWHSGELGLSGVGLQVLQQTVGPAPARPAVETATVVMCRPYAATTAQAHVRPTPPLALGPWLQRSGLATAAQDLSDSLSQVALQLARASGMAIELDSPRGRPKGDKRQRTRAKLVEAGFQTCGRQAEGDFAAIGGGHLVSVEIEI